VSKAGTIRFWLGRSIRHVIVILATLLSLFPIYFMIVSAFKSKDAYIANKWGLPTPPVLGNFVTAFSGENFYIRFANSIILTVGAVGVSLIIACLAAYAFARMDFRFKRGLLNLFISLMVVPPVVLIVPLFVSMVQWQMVNTYYGVILIYTGLMLPFSTYLMTNFFRTVPREIVDAALIDGASSFGIFWRIFVPLSAPAVMTLIVVNALWVWNELLIALVFLQKDHLKTLMVGIAALRSRHYVDIPATMAGLLIATIPILILYLFGQKYFIKGLVSGAIK
jgi:ABC-type glycerol-3-phosphate transport system permease component